MQATRKEFIIALDEGTTNAKAVVLDSRGQVVVKFSQPLAIQTPREGWVEQSGEVLVDASLAGIARAVNQSTPRSPGSAAAAPRFAMNCATATKSGKSRP